MNTTATITMPLSEYEQMKSDVERYKRLYDDKCSAENNAYRELHDKVLSDSIINAELAELKRKITWERKRNGDIIDERTKLLGTIRELEQTIAFLCSRTFIQRLFNTK